MHSPELIRDYGDYLEQHFATEILSRLPGYALFWATYIGNDGHSNYLPMPGARPEVLAVRVGLWEHLYTLFESFALCWHLEAHFAKRQCIENPTDYADNLNHWMAFYANLGRIHDMAEKVAGEFKGEWMFAPFDSFYEKRHTVLHYPKVPMAWVQNVLAAPRVGEEPKHWQQGMRWSEMKGADFEFLEVIASSTMRELEKAANTFLFKLVNLAASQGQFSPVKWPANIQTKSSTKDGTASPLEVNSEDLTNKIAALGNGPICLSGVALRPLPPPSGSYNFDGNPQKNQE